MIIYGNRIKLFFRSNIVCHIRLTDFDGVGYNSFVVDNYKIHENTF